MTHDTGDDSSFGPLISEWFFISDTVLDNNDRGLVLINGGSNRLDGCILINSLVGTDDVVISLTGFGGGLEHFLGNDGVFAVVLRVHNQALFKNQSIDLSGESGLDRLQHERTLALTAS